MTHIQPMVDQMAFADPAGRDITRVCGCIQRGETAGSLGAAIGSGASDLRLVGSLALVGVAVNGVKGRWTLRQISHSIA
jgi:hypothetical protein